MRPYTTNPDLSSFRMLILLVYIECFLFDNAIITPLTLIPSGLVLIPSVLLLAWSEVRVKPVVEKRKLVVKKIKLVSREL